ncbi:serine/threonine protein kinase [Gloeothece citriformis PCC 7424]|uniref:non-specific serine/threonine protein kinase n=1 Tax=Gloeothece citriformis (strain PCC 7424) TaxID=65393 RepID=B7KIJ3_GLOC7|nr:serine/threonine-protein kinase [Gloeothece citriformis]ACK69399.1 serine/threonine protein kinase [Gloeothece citriformis PCC 7424]
MTPEEFINFINHEFLQIEGKPVDNREEAIIRGSLQGLTYEEMKKNESALKGLNVSYIARFVAHNLWNKLNNIFQKKSILVNGERVRKSNLWDLIERINQQGLILEQPPSLNPLISLSDPMLDKVLLGRYRVIGDLASNEYSKTYLAEDIGFSQSVPCIVKQWQSNSEKMTQRFQREAWALQELGRHDQIPQLLADFEEGGYYYLVHQFIEGKYLSQKLILEQPWSEFQVVDLLKKILEVLAFIHQQNKIHREINPDNLIERDSDGKIVLIGFGSLKQVATGQTITTQNSNRGYIAPEQAVGSPRFCSDVYAVGKIGIQALTGIEPTKFKVDPNTLNTIWREHIQVNSHLGDILDKMICYDFRQRYSTATEALQALESLNLEAFT